MSNAKPPGFQIPPFARACREAAGAAWGASFEHPFVLGVADGTLPAGNFRYYQMQDARYLEMLSDTAALIATRTADVGSKLWWLDAARMGLIVEGELHAGYGRQLGFTAADIAAMELGPVTQAYGQHMIATAQTGTLVEAIAAFTPCPWLYVALGHHLLEQLGTIADDHPYAEWLQLYSGDDFIDYMKVLLPLLQEAADGADEAARQRALQAFRVSCRYEYMFWQQAWEQADWPL